MKKPKNSLTFGEIIREKRDILNLSIREVANSLKIDPSLLGKIERNERSATKRQVELLAEYLKIDRTFLMITCISDKIAYKILETPNEIEILKVTEQKVKYFKKQQ